MSAATLSFVELLGVISCYNTPSEKERRREINNETERDGEKEGIYMGDV